MSRDGYLPDGVEQEDIDRYLCGDEPGPYDDSEAERIAYEQEYCTCQASAIDPQPPDRDCPVHGEHPGEPLCPHGNPEGRCEPCVVLP